MWQQILDQINPNLPVPFELVQKRLIGGGDTCQSYQLTPRNGHAIELDKTAQAKPLFVKLCQQERIEQLESEAFNLQLLARSQQLKVPSVICCGAVRDQAFLALEYLPELTSDATTTQWQQLGQQLAALHRCGDQGMYGWDQDNYIGATVQPNGWQKKWSVFFSEQRIGWQLQLAEENGMHFASIEQLVDLVHGLLHDHHPEPSLLHGDLWKGNLGFSQQTPVIFDPACYYGDRETDLAMSELFTPLPQAFYDGYQSAWPLPAGYQQRKEIYNLYHLLNHANLFGGRYISQCEQAIQRLLQ